MNFFGSIYDEPKTDESEFLDINSLTNGYDKILNQRTKIYLEVLKKVHFKIKFAADNMKNECVYTIPEYIMGMPLYNFKRCKMFIMNRLVKEGFDIKFFIPNILYISWMKVLITPVSSNLLLTEKKDNHNSLAIKEKNTKHVTWKNTENNKIKYKPTGMFDINF